MSTASRSKTNQKSVDQLKPSPNARSDFLRLLLTYSNPVWIYSNGDREILVHSRIRT